MDQRMTFNQDAQNYDRYRPTYPSELFEEIFAYSQIGRGSRVLEVGCGTGQATKPFLQRGYQVTAVELGSNLAAYCQQKFASFSNFQAVHASFEEFASQTNFDLLCSATAFHWISREISFPKASKLLASGGTLALFWNHPFVSREDDPLHCQLQKLYRRYFPGSGEKTPVEFAESSCREYVQLLQQYGFLDVQFRLFRRERTMTAEQYLCLLETYSDHRSLPQEIKQPFYREISAAIQSCGALTIYDTIDLYLARNR